MTQPKTMTPPTANSEKSARPARPAAAPERAKYKVALVEDQPDVRVSWTNLINSFPDFACVFTCATGEEALRALR